MSLGPITHLTIHCAATPEGRDVKAATVEDWDRAKFGQVSYHWIVELDGTKHRSLPDDALGCHVHLHNHGNIGVCYVGGVDVHGNPKDTRTAAQKASLREIVADYRTSTRHRRAGPPRLARRAQGLPELRRQDGAVTWWQFFIAVCRACIRKEGLAFLAFVGASIAGAGVALLLAANIWFLQSKGETDAIANLSYGCSCSSP
jgi:N-acetylmuramoyl-L-alanine amidase